MQSKEYQKLRECPFCGSEAVIHESIEGRYYIMCSVSKICTVIPSTLVYSNLNDAVEAWNRRADDGKAD